MCRQFLCVLIRNLFQHSIDEKKLNFKINCHHFNQKLDQTVEQHSSIVEGINNNTFFKKNLLFFGKIGKKLRKNLVKCEQYQRVIVRKLENSVDGTKIKKNQLYIYIYINIYIYIYILGWTSFLMIPPTTLRGEHIDRPIKWVETINWLFKASLNDHVLAATDISLRALYSSDISLGRSLKLKTFSNFEKQMFNLNAKTTGIFRYTIWR